MKLFHPKNSPIATPARFRELYERNRLPVFRYVYGLTGGPQDDVEDLTAETFLRAWKARHRFDGDMDSATGWLIRIAKRLVIDEYRRSLQATRKLPADPPADPTPEQAAIADEQSRFLSGLLAGLPDEQREIIALRYMLGWRVNEIAQHLGTSENNVSVAIHRILSRLREKWAQAEAESLPAVFVQEEKIS
ncbi:MAG: sigma-70 family RNA polymerase sigma factor [Anaerolineales bacterium]|nr:sigma-70 family RNA polymerase sigma factor [Anaerolineales bacterium]